MGMEELDDFKLVQGSFLLLWAAMPKLALEPLYTSDQGPGQIILLVTALGQAMTKSQFSHPLVTSNSIK
jgi:hypothetical protein